MVGPTIIAAFARNRAIGKDNKLLWHISADLKRFKRLTLNQSLIMGHNTYVSIGKPLPRRNTIVMSRQERSIQGVTICSDPKKALSMAFSKTEKCFIAGGEEIYRLFLPFADELILTEVDCLVEGDTFFPEIEKKHWEKYFEERPKAGPKDDFSYSFCSYRRVRHHN